MFETGFTYSFRPYTSVNTPSHYTSTVELDDVLTCHEHRENPILSKLIERLSSIEENWKKNKRIDKKRAESENSREIEGKTASCPRDGEFRLR